MDLHPSFVERVILYTAIIFLISDFPIGSLFDVRGRGGYVKFVVVRHESQTKRKLPHSGRKVVHAYWIQMLVDKFDYINDSSFRLDQLLGKSVAAREL